LADDDNTVIYQVFGHSSAVWTSFKFSPNDFLDDLLRRKVNKKAPDTLVNIPAFGIFFIYN